MFVRQNEEPRSTWTSFNRKHSCINPEQSTIGYMPIIQAPAHELGTLNTIVQRVLYVTASLKQKHAVITVDQTLFPGLMELKLTVPQYRDVLIPRLGGLHISMNFLKVLGQHTADSRLADMWIESGILGPNSAEKALNGKSYAKGIRAHKLTLQAMWRLVLPQLLPYIENEDQQLTEDIVKAARLDTPDALDFLVTSMASAQFCNIMASFIASKEHDVNFQYWWKYMDMVCILLMFIRAQCYGLWELHLYSFKRMLPFFFDMITQIMPGGALCT